MSIERTFDLIINAGTSSPLIINANQNDSGETWIFNLYQEDGTKVTPLAGQIVGLKTDGHAIVNAGTVNASGQVVITETAQITACQGSNIFELIFDSVHGTANFILLVEKSPVDDDADFSESDISAINQAIAMAIDSATVQAIQNGLAQESATRAAQDAQLAGDISEEAATRAAADAVLRQAIDDAAIVPAGSTVVVDNTLSIAGAAADAKKTGDAVSDLNQALIPNIKSAKSTRAFFDVAQPSKNLFNPYHPDNRDGVYYDSVGRVIENASFGISHMVPVDGNAGYAVSGNGVTTAIYTRFYDDDFSYISTTNERIFTTPVNAKYLEFCYSVSGKYTTCQIEKGSVATEFEPYERKYVVDLRESLESKINESAIDLYHTVSKKLNGISIVCDTSSTGQIALKSFNGTGNAKIYSCGKNFIDVDNRRAQVTSEWSYDSTTKIFSTTNGYYRNCIFYTPYLYSGKTYTFSLKIIAINGTVRLKIWNEDGSAEYSLLNASETGYYYISFVPTVNGRYRFGFYGVTSGVSATIGEIQGELGALRTAYNGYVETTIDVTSTSVYPNYDLSSFDGTTWVFSNTTENLDAEIPLSVDLTVNREKETVLTVGTGKDYNRLIDAINACANPSPTNRYVIEFYGDGNEYDLGDETEEWNNTHSEQIGIMIPNYTTLKGIGGKDKCIFALRLESESSVISVLNTRASASLEGIKVIGYNTRYVVHDDYATIGSELKCERHVTDCHFIGEKLVYGAVWGAGFYSGCVQNYKNCIFENYGNGAGFTFHNNTRFVNNAKLYFKNCRVITAGTQGGGFGTLATNANGVINEVYFYGCKLKRISFFEQDSQTYGSGMLFRVSGFCNDIGNSDVVITTSDGIDYSSRIDLVGKY